MITPAGSHVDTRPYLLERVDEAAVVQLYADGFTALPVRDKILIYHLYQAAIAGRDIYYDQRYRHALEMREVLEQIVVRVHAVEGRGRGPDLIEKAQIVVYEVRQQLERFHL